MPDPLRALLIDDDETFRRFEEAALGAWEGRAVQLETARNGGEGVATATLRRFDVVLLDYRLPDTDGLQVLERLRAARPDVPVIMLTGEGGEHVAVQAIRRGAADYLAKEGLTPARLRQTVRSVLAQWSLRGEVERLSTQLLDRERAALVGALTETALEAFRDGALALDTILASAAHERAPAEERRRLAEEGRALVSGLREIEATLALVRRVLARPAQPHRVDLDRAVADVAALHASLAKRDVRIELDLAARAEARAAAEAVPLVLAHLLNNAADAMPEGGTVRVRTRAADGVIELSVEDEGPGVPPELVPAMFDLYVSGREGREGLGLALARHVALAQGGSLAYEPGARGARFVVRLPAAA